MRFLCCGSASDEEHDGASVPAGGLVTPAKLMDISLDPLTAMQRRYPRATRGQVFNFARSLNNKSAGQPAFVIMAAAVVNQWNIVHEMVENGISLNVGSHVDIYNQCLPWVTSSLNERPERFNSNMFAAICAFHGDLTIVRYIVERREQLGVDSYGLMIIPAIRMCNDHFDDGFWLLDNLPVNEREYTDACGVMVNAIVNYELEAQKPRLADAMRRRGAKGEKLFTLYASMPQALALRNDNVAVDSKTAMFLKYPMADMETVREFAAAERSLNPDDLAHVLQFAALQRKWNIVHTLLDMGISPQDSRAYSRSSALEDVSRALNEDPSSDKSNFMLATTAYAGEATVLRYMLSLQEQIKYSRVVYTWLPLSAVRGKAYGLANWLLNYVEFNNSEFEQAISQTLHAATSSGNVHSVAVYLDLVHKRSASVDLVAIAEKCLAASVSKMGVINAIVCDTWFSPDTLAAAAERVLPVAAKQQCHTTYLYLYTLVDFMDFLKITPQESIIAEIIAKRNLSAVKAQVAADSSVSDFDSYIYRALKKAAEEGKYDILNFLFTVQPAASNAMKAHCTNLLIAAAKSEVADVLRFVGMHAPKDNAEQYLECVKDFLRHVLAGTHVSNAMPLIVAEKGGPHDESVSIAAVVAATCYGLNEELEMVLAVATKNLSGSALTSMVTTAIDTVSGETENVIEKYEMLLSVAKQNAVAYSLALQQCMIVGGRNDSMDLISHINLFGEWHSEEARQDALLLAAKTACEFGCNDTLESLLRNCIQVPADVRMTWPFHPDTYEIALSGISNERLLAAQLAAAESDDGPNYVLVCHGLRSSRPTDAQLAASIEADDRHVAYLTRRNRAENGIEESDLPKVSDVVEVGTDADNAALEDRCVICCEPLLTPPATEPSPADEIAASTNQEPVQQAGDEARAHSAAQMTDQLVEHQIVTMHDGTALNAQNDNVAQNDTICPPSPNLNAPVKPVVRLKCNGHHVFHRTCVLEWFGKSGLCPTCKHDLKPMVKPLPTTPESS